MTTPHTTPELLACREAFVKKIKAENFDMNTAHCRWSLKQHWAGPKHGFADERLQIRWFDFLAGWKSVPAASQRVTAAPQEGVSLRDRADRLAEAGHDFWEACRKDAGGGAVRWLSLTDGTLIIFTRGEYRKALLEKVDQLPGTPVMRFEDDGGDGGVSAIAVEKVAPRFQQTYCQRCGSECGPGYDGPIDCVGHAKLSVMTPTFEEINDECRKRFGIRHWHQSERDRVEADLKKRSSLSLLMQLAEDYADEAINHGLYAPVTYEARDRLKEALAKGDLK